FKKSYDDHIDYHKYEKEKSEEFSKNKITNKLKDFGKAAFMGGDAVSIYKDWHASVFYINNASKIRYDDTGRLSMGSIGTGSLVDRSGLIITNFHVAGEAIQVWVYPFTKGLELLETGKFIGRIVAGDQKTDLALIQVTGIPQRIKPVSLGIVQNLLPGQEVFAIGHPHGEWTWSITPGIINQIRPDHEYSIGDLDYKATLIQNNAAISGGNSGGPLFTEDGKMVGVNTWSIDDEGAQNLNFAIGANHVKELIQNRDMSEVKVARTINPLTEKKLREQVAILGTYDDNSNGKVDGWAADKNNNGIMDAIYVDENEDKIIEIIYTDANENKSWDSILFDVDQDGQPNYRYIDREDQNDDMKWDAIEFDTNQDGKWDVIQEIPKS
ncbi:MAG: S1C family serine protease, partial [SAR202 cluster bacterium]|nr:S1C family serine protease [SAR202 cluster bacterium]